MPGLPITITDAGRAALVNAQNTGTVNLTISQVGVSAVHTAGPLAGLTVLPNELKRLNTFGGDVVAEDTLHLTIRDQSADTYSLLKFGLYLSNGVLFAVYSQAVPILEKSSAAMVLLATDIILTALTTANIEFGDTDFINPPATIETAGVVELATKEETEAGADTLRAVTPFGLKWVLDRLLAGFAALVHTHDAGDTISGVFNVGRIPALGMEKITGLAVALAGKSNTGHTHGAGDVVSGTFDVARIPDLLMAKITGLADALAAKSNAGHNHSADDTTSGVFAVGRIPSLAMEKITGLATALNLKLNGTDFTWNLLPGKPDVAIRATDTLFNSVQCIQGSSPTVGRVYLGDQTTGSRWMIYDGVRYQLPGAALWVNGSPVHTAATFDPASKAAAVHTHVAADITDLLDRYWPAGELRLFELNAIPSGIRAVVANGAVVSRTTYARLFNAIGTRYGAGDGATTFQLPDWRGVFFRGLDNGRGLDPDRVLGALQMSQNLAHFHSLPSRSNANSGNAFVEDADNSGGVQTAYTGTEGGTEARPVNQALLACITY